MCPRMSSSVCFSCSDISSRTVFTFTAKAVAIATKSIYEIVDRVAMVTISIPIDAVKEQSSILILAELTHQFGF